MKNILFISIAFPPKNDPECLQAGRYFKYLNKEKEWNIDVVTSASPTLFMPQDSSLKNYATGFNQLIEVPLIESKLLSYILRNLNLDRILFPDSKMTFHWSSKKVMKDIKTKPDLIYSRSNPISSAVMALKLKEHFDIPWVMHMSDPWVLSPLENIPASQLSKARSLEERFMSIADRITFTTQQTLDLYSSKYKQYSSRFSVLPNVYDPEDISEVPLVNYGKLRVVYTGGLAGRRNVFFLDQVLNILQSRNINLKDELEFIFAGDMDHKNRTFFEKGHSSLKHNGVLKYSEARVLCESAHILMVVDSPTASNDAIFFPSKLLDYFIVKRKIWAISPVGSVTREILEGSNHIAHDHEEIDAMVDFILESIRQLKANNLSEFLSIGIPEDYSGQKNANILSQLFKDQLTGNGPPDKWKD